MRINQSLLIPIEKSNSGIKIYPIPDATHVTIPIITATLISNRNIKRIDNKIKKYEPIKKIKFALGANILVIFNNKSITNSTT